MSIRKIKKEGSSGKDDEDWSLGVKEQRYLSMERETKKNLLRIKSLL